MACEPQFETRSIIVQGYSQRGIITDTKLLNPCPSPTVFPNYVGNYCPADNQGFNWYTSCLPFGITSERYETTSLSQLRAVHVEGPSLGEGQETPRNYIHLIGYTGSAQASQNTGIPYLPGITQGCNLKSGGPITGVRIRSSGIGIRTEGLGFRDLSGEGSGADFAQTISSGRLTSVRITAAGDGYNVGNSFESSFLSFGGGAAGGTWEVTSIGTSSNGVSGPARINWWIVDPNLVGNEFGGPGNYLYPTDGYAIGDIFEMQVPGENSKNTNARIEVTAITPTNLEDSQETLQFRVEKNVDLIYNINSRNRTVDLVRDYDQSSTTDEVLLTSCSEVFRIWLQSLSRPPTALEFEYYVKQIYDNEGQVGPDIAELIATQFEAELDDNVIQIRSECDGQIGDDEPELPSGLDCQWDRSTFYQGSNSAARNIQLKDLWDFLGQPNGPSGPGGGATVEDLVCPKPEAGQIADQEPDISDFAGMRLWRWKPCTDGSNGGNANIGQYEEIIVPCPGPEEGCVDPTIEDDLAVYSQGSKIFWNNGSSKVGNFVLSTKTAQAEAINNQYLTLFGRQAEQAGLVYWDETANRTIEDQYAVYWEYGLVKYRNGTQSLTPLVKSPKSANGIAVNNKYLDLLGRPADITGFGYWVNESNSIGITKTLQNIEVAAVPELNRGGVTTLEFGLSRTLSLIEEAGQAELTRGGVKEFKDFCQLQVSASVNLEFFLDTRLPPRYGTIDIQPPEISAIKLADSIYLNYSPASQTEIVKGFTTANSNQLDSTLDQRFTVNWPSFTGDLGNLPPPILVKYLRLTLYQSKDGRTGPVNINGGVGGTPAIQFVNYSDNRLEPIVGPKKLTQPPVTYGFGGSLVNNSTYNDVEAFFEYGRYGLSAGIPLLEGERIAFDEDPHRGRKFYWRIEAKSYALDTDTLEEITSLRRQDVFSSATDTQTMRFFGAWGPDPGPDCPEGEQTCPDGTVRCIGDDCGGGGGCNNLSISCGGNNNLNVETNQPTKISFSYRVNGANTCDTKGSAKVSIRKYWPCTIFGPPSGRENQWVVQKRTVPIVNGEAVYDLSVNTSKDDYLAVSYENQTVDDPGSCHWVYVAYWEINGMSSTSIKCDYNAWENPGCDNGTVRNFLDEILCVQKAECPEGCENSGDFTFGGGGCPSKECSQDCPVCEQTVKIIIGDTTSCGALSSPGLREGGGPGINNGRFLVGNQMIDNPNTLAPTIDRVRAEVYTRQLDGKMVVPISVENWVSVAPAKVGTLVTKGKDNAIDFDEVDNQALYDECCTNNALTFECIALRNINFCQRFEAGELTTNQEVDCSAQMRVVAQWYYKVKYKIDGDDRESEILPLPFWTKYDTPDERQIYNIDTDYYPQSAGNGTNGVGMAYKSETNDGSFYNGFDTAYLPADRNITELSVYLQIKASNDLWGDPKFDNPPPGFNERDFGTDITVLSPRPPHTIGSIPGPKPTIFKVGAFKLGETANLPSAEWSLGISGCADAQVYDTKPSNPGSFTCGDVESDNWYKGTRNNIFSSEEGKANGQAFSRDIYISGSACAGSVPNFNPNDGSGFNQKPAFCPTTYLPSFTNCYNQSDVRLKATGIGSVDYGDYSPGGCETGVKLIWYVDGVVRSKGYSRQGLGSNDSKYTFNLASCGEVWEDLSQWMTDSSRTYTVSLYAVVNNITNIAKKPVNRDWSTQNGDPYNFSGGDIRTWGLQRGDRAYPIEIVNAGGVAGEPIVIPPGQGPYSGDVFQVILSTATCTVKGNDGGDNEDLTGLQKPEFTITSSGETWEQADILEDFESGVVNCNPPCCNNTNSGNQCAELLGTRIARLCGPLLCANSGGGAGKLTATVQNLPDAWPRIPGTQTRVTGSVKYLWEYKNNANNWIAVDGGTGNVITYIADGRQYRCKVTFDLAGKVPDGYTAVPEQTTTTKIFTTDDIDTEVCPDGTVVQIGEPCPGDPGNCDQPERVNGNTAPVFLPATGNFGSTYNAKNGESVQVSYLPSFNNFSSVAFVANGSRAVLKFNNVEVSSSGSALGMLPGGDIRVLAGSGTVTGSNVTRTYTASFIIKYKCSLSATQVKTTYVDIPNAVTITWSQGGGEDNGYPKLITPPACFYSSGYLNSSRCGSYLAQWQNTATSAFTYYFHEKKNDISIDNRGAQYSPSAVASNASCEFCPSTTCPSVSINRVIVNPSSPKVNQRGTLQIDYTWVGNGFTEITNPFLNNGLYEQITWTGPGLGSTSGPQVNIGPFTTPGKRSYTVTIAKFYADPGQQCCIDNGIFKLCGSTSDSFDFTIDVKAVDGPDDPNDPDPPEGKEPVMTGTITGDSTLTLSNGKVTGNYKMDYNLYEGEEYRISDRPITVKWDDLNATFDKYDYSRTFTTAGTYVITARIAKLFAKPGWEGSVAGANTIPSEYQKYAYDDVNFNVRVLAEPSNDVAPTSSLTVSRTSGSSSMPLVDGKVTINFACQASFSNGTAVPTPAPSALRYNTIDGSNTGSTLVSGPTTASWSRTFTKAGTYVIGARFRKNYCADGLTTCTDSTPGKTFTLAQDSVRVTITDPQPTGTKPKATIQPITYSNTVGGCGLGTNISPVTATVTINLTQGTGDYAWDNATAPGYVKNGSKLVKTMDYILPRSYDLSESTTVTFTKGGKVVHTDASGTATGCVTIISINLPGGPGGPFNFNFN